MEQFTDLIYYDYLLLSKQERNFVKRSIEIMDLLVYNEWLFKTFKRGQGVKNMNSRTIINGLVTDKSYITISIICRGIEQCCKKHNIPANRIVKFEPKGDTYHVEIDTRLLSSLDVSMDMSDLYLDIEQYIITGEIPDND